VAESSSQASDGPTKRRPVDVLHRRPLAVRDAALAARRDPGVPWRGCPLARPRGLSVLVAQARREHTAQTGWSDAMSDGYRPAFWVASEGRALIQSNAINRRVRPGSRVPKGLAHAVERETDAGRNNGLWTLTGGTVAFPTQRLRREGYPDVGACDSLPGVRRPDERRSLSPLDQSRVGTGARFGASDRRAPSSPRRWGFVPSGIRVGTECRTDLSCTPPSGV
jgi:hypothetical protein